MIKATLRFIVVALAAYASWNVFVAYSAHYKFKDAVESASQYGSERTQEELRRRVLKLAEQFEVPVEAQGFSVRRKDKHTIIDGSYARPVALLPGFLYRWPFSWHVDTYTVKPPKLDGLPTSQ